MELKENRGRTGSRIWNLFKSESVFWRCKNCCLTIWLVQWPPIDQSKCQVLTLPRQRRNQITIVTRVWVYDRNNLPLKPNRKCNFHLMGDLLAKAIFVFEFVQHNDHRLHLVVKDPQPKFHLTTWFQSHYREVPRWEIFTQIREQMSGPENFMIWKINSELWAVVWAGLWEKRVWADYEQLLRPGFFHFFGVKIFF